MANPNEANSVLGTAQGTASFYNGYNFMDAASLNYSSKTSVTSTTSGAAESIQLVAVLNANGGPSRGTASTIDYGSLKASTPITYQIVEG